ncbi:c-type cytochrome [Microvirga guangxiensis]|uniref:Cytochrome C oxidase, cbb3-type, subunit III n=1 Tax=Microvirga guangxiensis TaxID=549386 RepID=A0A1G5F1D7_9HYPH|nr:cytochrome c [Microvirga guangxiensis]SCY32468.1 Cytochrome C oxidase, cbb3-type, subunit III [Microvirga guangxiensis]
MRLAVVMIGLSLLTSCDTGTEQRDEVASTRTVQRPYVPVPPGVIPRGTAAQEAALAAPGPQVTPGLIARGEERFRAFCSPCHGLSGRGDGTVVSRGFPPPPSYHEERVKALSAEQIATVITEGRGRMFSYADRVLPEDRWAIAHYVKQLQAEGGTPMRQGEASP